MKDDSLDSWLRKYVSGGHEEKIKTGGQENAENTKKDAKADFTKKKKRRRGGGRDKKVESRKIESRGKKGEGRGKRMENRRSKGNPHALTHKKFKRSVAPIHKDVLRIIPLGGLSEVGKNMTAFEYEENIVLVDVGFQFPEEDMLGIDYVIPDISYLKDKASRVKAAFITHGHLDHIGAIPYLLPQLNNPPVYSTKLTRGLIEKRLEEFNLLKNTTLHTIDPAKDVIHVGKMKVSFFRVNHSIPDAIGIKITTPQGKVVHSGDFKFDPTPADGIPADMEKIAGFGKEGITLLMSDSTNATRTGSTKSEKEIGESLDAIISGTKGRLIIASFSSLIGRIQQILNSAKKYDRKVFISGRSMIQNLQMAKKLGYIKYPEGLVQTLKQNAKSAKKDNALIITTGSQGESMSALTRIAMGEHAQVQIKKGDTVIFSSSPIIGNERSIYTVINNLARLGARVIDNQIMDVHTSGHGRQEDLKAMINYVKPKHFLPIHGEYYMRQAHADLAMGEGIPEKNIFKPENGEVVQIKNNVVSLTGEQADSGYVLIDGSGIGDKGARVLMERQELANNGVLIILFKTGKNSRKLTEKPKVYSRGFIYQSENEKITQQLQQAAEKAYSTIIKRDPKAKYTDLRNFVRSNMDRLTHKLLSRRPLIIPIIINC